MGGNELAYRRMMKALKLRQTDTGDMARASLARNGLELARLLDGTLEPRDRVATVRELRQVTEKLIEAVPQRGAPAANVIVDSEPDDDDWDTPSLG